MYLVCVSACYVYLVCVFRMLHACIWSVFLRVACMYLGCVCVCLLRVARIWGVCAALPATGDNPEQMS